MRSEHLHDCTAFADFPEVINATSYLVRRLTDTELEDAIVRPVSALWTDVLVQREEDGLEELGAPQVSDSVIRYLLKDVNELKHDPDQLPLFQHCLYWLWRAAKVRAEKTSTNALPDALTEDDLLCAVCLAPPEQSEPTSLKDHWNGMLAQCVNEHADRAFENLDEDRVGAQRLLSVLGFRDQLNTIKRTPLPLSRLNEVGLDQNQYRRIFDHFNREHPYLRETPSGETDIYHEALIRKWKEFEGWVIEEYERGETYRRVCFRLRKWRASGKPDDPDLWLYRKVVDDAVDKDLDNPELGILKLERYYDWDADPLSVGKSREALHTKHRDAVTKFIADSRSYHDRVAREEAAGQRRIKTLWRFVYGFLGLVLLLFIGWILDASMMEREARAFHSFVIASVSALRANPYEEQHRRLIYLWQDLVATRFFRDRGGNVSGFSLPFSMREVRLLNARRQTEVMLNESLRRVLSLPLKVEANAPGGGASVGMTGVSAARNSRVGSEGSGSFSQFRRSDGDKTESDSAAGGTAGAREVESGSPVSVSRIVRIEKDQHVECKQMGSVAMRLVREGHGMTPASVWADNNPLLTWPAGSTVTVDEHCQVILAAVPTGGGFSLHLYFLSWRYSEREKLWKPDRNIDAKGPIEWIANSPIPEPSQLAVELPDTRDLSASSVVEITIGNRTYHVASMRSEPWPLTDRA